MSNSDYQSFLKNIVILHDTREQKSAHIIDTLDDMGIAHQKTKLDFGDYSFRFKGKDFSLSCVIERKANPEELYGNISKDVERITKEMASANENSADFYLLIENISGENQLKNYILPDETIKRFPQIKVYDIGKYCYSAIKSWQCRNRYNIKTIYVSSPETSTVKEMLLVFYYYYRNYKKSIASRRNR